MANQQHTTINISSPSRPSARLPTIEVSRFQLRAIAVGVACLFVLFLTWDRVQYSNLVGKGVETVVRQRFSTSPTPSPMTSLPVPVSSIREPTQSPATSTPTTSPPTSHPSKPPTPTTLPPSPSKQEEVAVSSSVDNSERFFGKALNDIDVYKGVTLSVNQMKGIVSRKGFALGLFRFSKHEGSFSWTHISGLGTNFWSTQTFHKFVTRNANAIGAKLPADFKETYLIINSYDEPVSTNACPNLAELQQLHANIQRGVVNENDHAPVWSMSKVRGCHLDLLMPTPDLLESSNPKLPVATTPVWAKKNDVLLFRGSTTGFGTMQTNMRLRTVAALKDLPGVDMGITAKIQNFARSSSVDPLMKPAIEYSVWNNYKYILEMDGNAHSYNRPISIARAGATMVRLNLFTELFNDGLEDGVHCFDLSTTDTKNDAIKLMARLRANPDKSAAAAKRLSKSYEWFSDDVLVEYLGLAFAKYSRTLTFTN
eukprot:m.13274 g.13274  ORF g.13274 m.13274 type:complete len:483 (-) comp9667_c0_seq1:108-1556(-)